MAETIPPPVILGLDPRIHPSLPNPSVVDPRVKPEDDGNGERSKCLLTQNNPNRMNDAGQIAAQRQKNIEPEMKTEANLQKHADRRQDDGEKNANDVHD